MANILAGKAMPTQEDVPPSEQTLALHPNIRQGSKNFPRTNALAYYSIVPVPKKTVYNLETWANVIKLFKFVIYQSL